MLHCHSSDAESERAFVHEAGSFYNPLAAGAVQFRRSLRPEKSMLHVALWEPEIPPNTGNVARLCAATGARLHLIGRLGFRLDDRTLRRAGLDYWDAVDLVRHVTFEEFEHDAEVKKVWCVETPGSKPYTRASFADGDCLLFGAESKGLPPGVREKYAATHIGIPMPAGRVRSLNLATAVGIVLYEALRQLHDW
jgi:tRNA (cytidine/uridine-2'-O-)-methyltransferase